MIAVTSAARTCPLVIRRSSSERSPGCAIESLKTCARFMSCRPPDRPLESTQTPGSRPGGVFTHPSFRWEFSSPPPPPFLKQPNPRPGFEENSQHLVFVLKFPKGRSRVFELIQEGGRED